MSQFQAVPN